MLVLALDTTTREGSCALARDGCVLREQASDASKPQAARLPGDLMALLEHEHVTLADIDIYAVSIGPGSFTGLRVGIATMQGLAFAAGKPLIGISALDALHAHEVGRATPPHRAGAVGTPVSGAPGEPDKARPTGLSEDTTNKARPAGFLGETGLLGDTGLSEDTRLFRVATWIDAWRGEIYAALYEGGVEVEAPAVAHPDDLLPRLAGTPTLFIGDGAGTYADAIRAVFGSAAIADPVMPPLAGTIARLATEAARAGHLPPPHAIRPIYVRRTDPPSPLGGFGATSSKRAV